MRTGTSPAGTIIREREIDGERTFFEVGLTLTQSSYHQLSGAGAYMANRCRHKVGPWRVGWSSVSIRPRSEGTVRLFVGKASRNIQGIEPPGFKRTLNP